MSWGYQESKRDDLTSAAVIHRALELGVDFIDTAAVYGDGHNESLVGQALADRREEVVVATKGGLLVTDLAERAMRRDGSPEALKGGVESSLRRLGTGVIDLYYLHRVDDNVPVEESWGALAQLVDQGLIRWLGLSEVDIATAQRAHAVHPVTAIQSELSLWTRDALGQPTPEPGAPDGPNQPAGTSTPDPDQAAPIETPDKSGGPGTDSGNIVEWCAVQGVSFVPYAPLGRGFLTGALPPAAELDTNDFRALNARFQGDAVVLNSRIVDVVRAVAERHDALPAQVALAWTMAQGHHVIPIPGTKQVKYLEQNVAAEEIELTAQDLAELDGVPGAVGARF